MYGARDAAAALDSAARAPAPCRHRRRAARRRAASSDSSCPTSPCSAAAKKRCASSSALLARGLEPRPALLDMPPRPRGELAGVRLGLADDLGDLVVAVVEDVVQQQHRALLGGQALEQRRGTPGRASRPSRRARAGSSPGSPDERLRQPLADVALPPRARRAQLVDRQPRRHRRDGRRAATRSRSPRSSARVNAQQRLLDDVLGLGHAAEHPVGDRERPRPQLLVELA